MKNFLSVLFFLFVVLQANSQTPIHHWTFDGQPFDSEGNLMGSLIGEPLLITDQSGNSGGAYQFSSGQHVLLKNSSDDLSFMANTGVYTLSLYFKLDQLTQRVPIFSSFSSGDPKAIYYELYTDGAIYMSMYGSQTANWGHGSGTVSVADGNWHHLVVVADGSNLQHYVDGVAAGTSGSFAPGNLISGLMTNSVKIGSGKGESIDDVKVFDVALTAQQILTLYQTPTAPYSLPPGTTVPQADHHWTLDGIALDSEGGLEGAFLGDPQLVDDAFGNADRAYEFTSNDQIQINNSESNLSFIANSGVFSISMFFKTNPVTSRIHLFSSYQTGGKSFLYEFYQTGQLNYSIYGSTVEWGSGTGNITADDGAWHHVAVVSDGSSVHHFLDGVPYGEEDNFILDNLIVGDMVNPVRIGSGLGESIDDVKIFNTALSPEQIYLLSQTESPAYDPGAVSVPAPLHHWTLNGTAFDESGVLNGQIIGVPALAADRNGEVNKAFLLNKNNGDYINLPGSEDDLAFIPNSGNFAVSMFVKLDDLTGRIPLLWSSKGVDKGFYFERYSDGTLNYQIYNSAQPFGVNSGSATIQDNDWHHVAVVGDGTMIQTYLDGVPQGQAGTINANNLIVGNNDNPVVIGESLSGSIDDVRIYNVALSSAQVYALSQMVDPVEGGSSLWTTADSGGIFYDAGNVSVGSSYFNTEFQLAVKGEILTEGVSVRTYANWPDYVFDADYLLKPLSYVKVYIDKNGHLPGFPSAAKIADEGYGLQDILAIQQEKIEELTLYLIQHEEAIAQLKEQLKAINEQLAKGKK